MRSQLPTRRWASTGPALGAALGAALTLSPVTAADPDVCGTLDGAGCAPASARVDLEPPVFSDPTTITNPLHPSALVTSVLMLGRADGQPFRAEVTLLPEPVTIDLDGVTVSALESQYVSFLDGRIAEIALDWYAQADDGSVWYLGEDVFNFEDGVVADTEGTWLAGRDGPAAMIMPADPQPGAVYRPENIPGEVFEEVTVRRTGLTVDGPGGPVTGAIEIDELHLDGGHETKLFAPGYGEFATGSGGEIEAVALAVPTDARAGGVPAELGALSAAVADLRASLVSGDRKAAQRGLDAVVAAWTAVRGFGVPAWLTTGMTDAIDQLGRAVASGRPLPARLAGIAVARAVLDLELRYRAPDEIDADRAGLWLDEVEAHAASDEVAGVRGAVAALAVTRDRFAHTLAPDRLATLDAAVATLREAADAGRLGAAARAAQEVRTILDG